MTPREESLVRAATLWTLGRPLALIEASCPDLPYNDLLAALDESTAANCEEDDLEELLGPASLAGSKP